LLKISLNGSKRERLNPMSPNSDPLLLLTNEALGAEWNQQGLPPDIFSIENGTILVNSERYSLIIDPQLQGISWIREKEKKRKTTFKSIDWVTRLWLTHSKCLLRKNGYSVLLENLYEQIDATLNPIIARNIFKRGKNRILNERQWERSRLAQTLQTLHAHEVGEPALPS
jgi:dynein heavy chain